MKDTTSQLKKLLEYWLEHNQEHGAEFREWAEKVAPLNKEAAGELQKAADKMAEADEYLKKAQKLVK